MEIKKKSSAKESFTPYIAKHPITGKTMTTLYKMRAGMPVFTGKNSLASDLNIPVIP